MYTLHGVETIYEQVRDLIVSGSYSPGVRMTEQELSTRLNVSRTPVREALRMLESDGLVRGAGRGVTVVALSGAALREVYEVRAALEGLTAQLAARRQLAGEIPPAALDRLVVQADRADEATRSGDLTAGVRHNRAFHRQVALLADNALALRVLDQAWDQIVVSTRVSLTRPDRPANVDAEHRRLIAAVVEGRAADAAAIASEHVIATLAAQDQEGSP
jgi:DNA-binding GntR family transcriptional regulator